MSPHSAIDGLRREHANMRSVLMLVSREIEHLERMGTADFVLLANALYYMRKFPGHVHHPKEELIFRRLAELDPAWKGEVDRLHAQHEEIYSLEDELIERALDAPKQGSEAVQELAAKGRRYLQVQREHSETEERVLFPQAEATLGAKDWTALANRIRSVEDPLFGRAGDGRYRMLYEHLLREASDL